jgi:hypothetical protein
MVFPHSNRALVQTPSSGSISPMAFLSACDGKYCKIDGPMSFVNRGALGDAGCWLNELLNAETRHRIVDIAAR